MTKNDGQFFAGIGSEKCTEMSYKLYFNSYSNVVKNGLKVQLQ